MNKEKILNSHARTWAGLGSNRNRDPDSLSGKRVQQNHAEGYEFGSHLYNVSSFLPHAIRLQNDQLAKKTLG